MIPRLRNGCQDSILNSDVSLEAILCTDELHRRSSRSPDYEKENRALVKLESALAASPSTILQTLAETILDMTQCDSAGHLQSVTLVDVKVVRFLDACEKNGVALLNCSPYIREWMVRENARLGTRNERTPE